MVILVVDDMKPSNYVTIISLSYKYTLVSPVLNQQTASPWDHLAPMRLLLPNLGRPGDAALAPVVLIVLGTDCPDQVVGALAGPAGDCG